MLFLGRIGSDVGGGLCQLSNLIFWMTFHTPLTVTERYRHSHDVFPDANRTPSPLAAVLPVPIHTGI